MFGLVWNLLSVGTQWFETPHFFSYLLKFNPINPVVAFKFLIHVSYTIANDAPKDPDA